MVLEGRSELLLLTAFPLGFNTSVGHRIRCGILSSSYSVWARATTTLTILANCSIRWYRAPGGASSAFVVLASVIISICMTLAI